MTLKKIDLFEYDLCQNRYLKEDMDRHAKKSINRYHSLCKSLSNLADAKGRDPGDKFVFSGTAQMFNLSFDLSWKVMKDIITEYHGALKYFLNITSEYYQLMNDFVNKAAGYYI